MFVQALREHPDQSQPSRYGHLAVAVPGLVAGRCQLLEWHGTLPLSRLIEPAVRLAETGFPVDKHYVEAVEGVSRIYAREPTLKDRCPYVFHTHLCDGRLPKVGDVLKQPALARLLRAIGEGGREFFYRGPVATAIAREMRQSGGILSAKDLFEYRVKQRKPVRATYRDFELILMPSPSSGGVALAQTLNILEVMDHKTLTKTDPRLAVHYQIEAMKHAFADRARWFGDADFSTVPIDRLVSKTYARELAARLQPNAVQSSETYGTRHGTPQWPSDAGTSHFCIVDEAGNVVVSSETINTSFGSLVAVDEWGLILQQRNGRFRDHAGRTERLRARTIRAEHHRTGQTTAFEHGTDDRFAEWFTLPAGRRIRRSENHQFRLECHVGRVGSWLEPGRGRFGVPPASPMAARFGIL